MREIADELRDLFEVPVDRRRMLRLGSGGVVLLGVGAILPSGCRSYPKPGVSLRFLTPKEYAIVNAVAERILGADVQVGAGDDRVDVAANVDAAVSLWRRQAQRQLRTILRVFEHGTYLFDLQRKRFTLLAPAQQETYLGGWINSSLGVRRIIFRTLKALCAAGYYQDRRTWSRLAYDGPWLGRVQAEGLVEPAVPVSLQTFLAGGR